MADSGWGGGCLSCRAAKVVSLEGARVSSELAILTAPLKSPSSSLAETRAANDPMGSQIGVLLLLGRGLVVASTGKSASASICLLTSVAKEHC